MTTDLRASTLLEIYLESGEDEALDYLYAVYGSVVLESKDLLAYDDFLRSVEIEKLPLSVLYGLLMSSFAWKRQFPSRPAMYARIGEHLKRISGGFHNPVYLENMA